MPNKMEIMNNKGLIPEISLIESSLPIIVRSLYMKYINGGRED